MPERLACFLMKFGHMILETVCLLISSTVVFVMAQIKEVTQLLEPLPNWFQMMAIGASSFYLFARGLKLFKEVFWGKDR